MDDKKCSPHDIREHMLIDVSSRCSKQKSQLGQPHQGNSTPISSLCDSLSTAVLSTPVRNFSKVNDQVIIGSTSNHDITPVSSLSHSSCQTTESSAVESNFLPPINIFSVKEKVNATPRRNPRRSTRYSSFRNDFEDQYDENANDDVSQKTAVLINNILQSDSLLGVSSNDIREIDDCSEVLDLCTKESVVSSKCNEHITACLPQDNSPLINNCESKYVNDGLQKMGNVEHETPSVISDTSKYKAISEPKRRTRKSDIGVSSVHRLRFSAKRPSFRKKNIAEEYDPDNDIFLHGVMPTHFNDDSLKSEIGKFLGSSNVAVTGLKRSQSCGTLSNLSVPVDVVSPQCSTPKRKPTKQTSETPLKNVPIKRTVSAPNLLERVSEKVKPSEQFPKDGAVRAFLRARDIIMNIHKRRNMNNLNPQGVNTPFNKVKTSQNSNNLNTETLSTSFDSIEDSNIHNKSLETNDPSSDADSSIDFSLPPTQPFESLILREVTAYVEVISNNENISAGVRTELMKLGATVVSKFNKNIPVTHVIFNDGLISTYKKAKKRNIPLVSVLWIEECRKAGVKVHESLYPPYQIERYESPSVVKQLQKRKILHFPSDDRPRPSPRRKKGVTNVASSVVDNSEKNIPVRKRSSVPQGVNKVAGDNGMMRVLLNMTGIGPGEYKDIVQRPPTPDSEVESDVDNPLAVRLLRKLAKNLDVPVGGSNETELQNKGTIDCNIPQTDKKNEVKEIEESSASKNQISDFPKELVPVKTPENSSTHDLPNLSNVTQRKKISKRKLMSTIDETVCVSDDNSVCGDVSNPYNITQKHVDSDDKEKKKKLCKSADRPLDDVNMKDSDINNAEHVGVGNDYPIRRSRRNSVYFVNNKKRKASPVSEKPSIVCTLLHSADVDMIASIVDKLGTYVLETNVTSLTTHVVAGDARRTMKLLKGMVRGCWIVSRDWVLKSLEADRWLDEEEFELTSFSPSVQKYRLEKLSFGAMFKPDIFRDCGRIFVSSKSSAPRSDLVELILLCGGHISSRISNATIIVGKKQPGVTSVTPLWVLDSVTSYTLKPFDLYLCS